MAIEIERKFSVSPNMSFEGYESDFIAQGYICTDPNRTVRVRIRGGKGFLTIKGLSDTGGASRYEWEQEISFADAADLLKLCPDPPIKKRRYLIPQNDLVWEVDVFEGENKGLVIAEIELHSGDQEFSLPSWVGEELTADPRYYNSYLSTYPYSSWELK